jgi:hypothetical protein
MTTKDPAPAADEPAPSLPSDRAFVVQFADTPPEVRGRVEHLASGRATRFRSWVRLRGFVQARLREAGRRDRSRLPITQPESEDSSSRRDRR